MSDSAFTNFSRRARVEAVDGHHPRARAELPRHLDRVCERLDVGCFGRDAQDVRFDAARFRDERPRGVLDRPARGIDVHDGVDDGRADAGERRRLGHRPVSLVLLHELELGGFVSRDEQVASIYGGDVAVGVVAASAFQSRAPRAIADTSRGPRVTTS